ncbi:hypothetical protein PMZ80_003516 [Knufia obscura]|uniref:Uncharacterized protein n=1 Tax=Knufia obscura TaxID=1635080 RepID=A0ABR0RUI0_9EURO|nr:hypothetical protein PMZ80_003516 [Knufia obscura]
MLNAEQSSGMSRSVNNSGAGLPNVLELDSDMGQLNNQEAGRSTPEAVQNTALDANPCSSAYTDHAHSRRALSAANERKRRSGRGSIGKSSPTTSSTTSPISRRPSSPLRNILGSNQFKATKPDAKQDKSKQLLKLALENATAVKDTKYACRQTHKPRIQYHDHDSVALRIDKYSCALCAMGIPLREDHPNEPESSATDSPQDAFSASLLDALPDFTAQTQEPTARLLPLEQLSHVQLTGGPSGTDTLTTTSTCTHCGYALDQFADLASLTASAAWVVADTQGANCNHYDCYVKVLQGEGVWAADWASLMAILAGRGLFGYTVQR